jgi:precorrin-6B methylase 2
VPRRTAVTLAPMFTWITSPNVVRNLLVSLACVAALASSALSLKSARVTEPGLTVDENRSASRAAAADVSDAESRYTYREDHDPNGIGKFYFDREIAHVMGFGPGGQGAQWLERTSREREERLALLVRSLRLKSGDVVADIGAGSGVVSLLMSEAVLPDGRVMAVDVQDEMLERLQARCDELQVTNVVPVKGTEKSPNLAPNSIDLAIMVDVYHEFEYPWEMMSQIAAALKPGGRVVFVEYRMEDPDVPIKLVHKMSQQQVRREIEQPEFGLKWTETIHLLPRQHIIVFTR